VTTAFLITAIFALSLAVDQIVEMFKSTLATTFPDYPNWRPGLQRLVIQGVAAGVGILLAFGFQLNIATFFPGFADVAPQVGMIATGLMLSFGSKTLHTLLDSVIAWRDNQRAATQTELASAESIKNAPRFVGEASSLAVASELTLSEGEIGRILEAVKGSVVVWSDESLSRLAGQLMKHLDAEGVLIDVPATPTSLPSDDT